jgi:CRP/FNR family transcriptional regulator
MHVADILQECRLFSKIEAHSFQRIAAIARLCDFDKGELIFREGQACPGVYIVGHGLVHVYRTAANGKEHVLHMVGPGNTFAEAAVIGRFDCPASARAVVPTTCALLPLDAFKRLLEEDHELCMEMMLGLAVWVRQLVDLLQDVVLRDALGRVARFLVDAEPDAEGLVAIPSLKRHLANHLNLTGETLSRSIRRLVDGGLIREREDGRVEVLGRGRLQQVADGLVANV